jgi:hypothetical protein
MASTGIVATGIVALASVSRDRILFIVATMQTLSVVSADKSV